MNLKKFLVSKWDQLSWPGQGIPESENGITKMKEEFKEIYHKQTTQKGTNKKI